ncbi:hypothetical protein [Archaeoglobus sp.]
MFSIPHGKGNENPPYYIAFYWGNEQGYIDDIEVKVLDEVSGENAQKYSASHDVSSDYTKPEEYSSGDDAVEPVVEWDKTYGGSYDDGARSIIETSDGYVVAGYTESKGAGGSDVWVIKLTPQDIIDAKQAINEAKQTISEEKSKGFNIAEAEELLTMAEQELNSGNGKKAESLAEEAMYLAIDIDRDGISNEKDFLPYMDNNLFFRYALMATIAILSITIPVAKYRAKRIAERKRYEEEKAKIIAELEEIIENLEKRR